MKLQGRRRVSRAGTSMRVPEMYALLVLGALLSLERCGALLLQFRARRILRFSPITHPLLARSSGRGYRYAHSDRRGSRSLRCAAVALAVSTSSVYEGEDHDSIAPSHLNDNPVSREFEERTLVGEIVLSDWLDELPLAALSLPGVVDDRRRKEQGGQGHVQVIASASGSQRENEDRPVGGDSEQGDDDTPFRFQQLIQRMWSELSKGDQLNYLGQDGQARVKGALTILAAYGALREHPLQAGVSSPQQAFSEMDFNRDGEVSFDEFVRWYSMSAALERPQPPQPADAATATAADSIDTSVAPETVDAGATSFPSIETSTARTAGGGGTLTSTSSGASRLMADLETATLSKRRANQSAAPRQQKQQKQQQQQQQRVTNTARPSQPPPSPTPRGGIADDSVGRGEWPLVVAQSAASWGMQGTVGAGLGATEAEKEAARERWLAGGDAGIGVELPRPEPKSGDVSAAEDLEKALELLCILVKASADADTLIAALASCMIRNPMGRYNLEVIEEQFGPIIRGIVEDRLLLERLPEPTSSESYLAIRQSYGVKPVLDLDDYHAKLMRDFLVHSSRDARAVVVHMADLVCSLRDRSRTPAYARHSLALEALQIYVPVSNALGLGSSFRELEELGYRALFPQTYSNMALWHRDVMDKSHDIVRDVKKIMLDALHAREDISGRVRGYRVESRTKGLVSTFRKVFRQNKRATDVHDILGFRIIVSPRPPPDNHAPMAAASREASTTTSPEDNSSGHQSVDSAGSRGKGGYESSEGKSEGARRDRTGGGSTTDRSVVAVKAFPPPYRDSDSRLLHDVYEVLVGLFDEVPGRFKNYADFPKANGYRSLHTTVVHSIGLKMELQVRTAEMHADAEGGDAAHSLYKGDLENPAEASRFRSKMTPNNAPPVQHQLPSKG